MRRLTVLNGLVLALCLTLTLVFESCSPKGLPRGPDDNQQQQQNGQPGGHGGPGEEEEEEEEVQRPRPRRRPAAQPIQPVAPLAHHTHREINDIDLIKKIMKLPGGDHNQANVYHLAIKGLGGKYLTQKFSASFKGKNSLWLHTAGRGFGVGSWDGWKVQILSQGPMRYRYLTNKRKKEMFHYLDIIFKKIVYNIPDENTLVLYKSEGVDELQYLKYLYEQFKYDLFYSNKDSSPHHETMLKLEHGLPRVIMCASDSPFNQAIQKLDSTPGLTYYKMYKYTVKPESGLFNGEGPVEFNVYVKQPQRLKISQMYQGEIKEPQPAAAQPQP